MTGLLLALLWVVAGLVLVLLSLPYHVRLSAMSEPVRRVLVELRPVSGAGPLVMRLDSSRMARRPGRTVQPRKARERGHGGDGARLRRALRHAPGLLGSLAGSVRLEFLRVGGRIGLDDPAETGRLFGLIYPLRFLPLGRRVRLAVEPAFDGAAFSGEAALAVRVVPVRVLLPVLVFGWRVLAGRG